MAKHVAREAARRFQFGVHMQPHDTTPTGPSEAAAVFELKDGTVNGRKPTLYEQVLHFEREYRRHESAAKRYPGVLKNYLDECQRFMRLASGQRNDPNANVVPAYQRASQLEWDLKVKLGLV